MTRLIEYLADDLGLEPRTILLAFAQLPVAVLVAAAVWLLVATFVAVAS